MGRSLPFYRTSGFRVFWLFVFVICYVVLGGLIFMFMEGPWEEDIINEIRRARSKFLSNNTCISEQELEDFIVAVVKANNRGVSAAANASGEPNWSFGQSLFFAGTILTTIGYGHVTPLSEGGKIFCMVYALIGIPLTLIMFTALVERLMILTAKFLRFLQEKLGHLYKSLHIRLMHLSIILLILVIFIFLIPAGILTVLEDDWNYLDAIYYCFISLTTIGLGDYIPGDNPQQQQRALYKICTTGYLFVGLIMMMLTLANVYEIPELNLGFHFYLKSDDPPEDDERKHLRTAETAGPRYTEHVNEAVSEQ